MRIMGVDAGAKRAGISVIESGPKYLWSTILGLDRIEGQKYQEYRLELINYWTYVGKRLLDEWNPDLFVSETIPLIGSGSAAQQSILVTTSITTLQALCFQRKIPVKQVAAISVKSKIGGNKTASKVKIRDGVLARLEMTDKEKNDVWSSTIFDESDSLGVSILAHDLFNKD